jgi:hypothetical protein
MFYSIGAKGYEWNSILPTTRREFQPTPVDLWPMLGRLAGGAFRNSARPEEESTVLFASVESKSIWPIWIR